MKPVLLAATSNLLLAALTQPALAHAILIRSDPAPAASVPAGPLKVTLEYNSRIDFARSVVRLSAPDGSQTVLKLNPSAANIAAAEATPAAPGTYTLRWQVLATDGHITRGVVPFTVTGNATAAAANQ